MRGWMGGRMDGRVGWMDSWMEGRMDKANGGITVAQTLQDFLFFGPLSLFCYTRIISAGTANTAVAKWALEAMDLNRSRAQHCQDDRVPGPPV